MTRGALLVVVLVVLLLLGGDAVVDRIVNGPRVGPKTEVGDDGLVEGDPFELAAQTGLEPNTYALARCLVSEHGQDPDAYLEAVGWAVRNYAAERGKTIVDLLTAPNGRFGAQNSSAGTKYASTRFDPSERHVTIAVDVMTSGPELDPTGGATHFYSPAAQDALVARGASGYTRDAAALDAAWRRPGGLYPQGAVPVVPAGIDPRRLTLYRRAV